MTRLLLLGALAVALGLGGTARADTFIVLPTGSSSPLPASASPNTPSSLTVPAAKAGAGVALSLGTMRELWMGAGATYGVPWQVLAAINKIESNFGRNMGPSSAGAVGWMQFMPSTWLRWGTDADGDGLADPANPTDAIYSAARYLAAAGARTDIRRGVFAYNHADWYVNQVLDLASLYAQGGTEIVGTLDRLQVAVDDARERVTEASSRVVTATASVRRLARAENALLRRATSARLLSDGLILRKRAARVGGRRYAAELKVRAVRAELATARQVLEQSQEQAQESSFAPAAALQLGAPVYSGSYVFPVGGGPGTVSVGRTHHDYPAADIAAPQGAPVYALADAMVVRSWDTPRGRCGIGAVIATADGQTWTYCHLSYLDAGVIPGVRLQAGASIGLVGSTGRSTGPHLHLALSPTTSYPQEQAWFSGFAGRAFRWQGEPTQPSLGSIDQQLFTTVDRPVAFTGRLGALFNQNVVYFTR